MQTESRVRPLTDKGQEYFQSVYNKHHKKYEATRIKLLEFITSLSSSDQLHTFESDLYNLYEHFTREANELSQFLLRTNTVESESLHQAILIQMDHAKLCKEACLQSLGIKMKIKTEPYTQLDPPANMSSVTN